MESTITSRWKHLLNESKTLADTLSEPLVAGRVTKVTGLVMEAVGLRLPVGSACTIHLMATDYS